DRAGDIDKARRGPGGLAAAEVQEARVALIAAPRIAAAREPDDGAPTRRVGVLCCDLRGLRR
ncbi:MAG: hypothetical protein KDA60_21135, partial [Planctomycetales bacterium]|nr:hypothetical protein [Planctomycetales bacterium]